ncbi:MAG: threonine/serine dehydratase [Anaerolineae bacterium]|nr:threonine/serine dehydratase [Anaerolineae bacterium]
MAQNIPQLPDYNAVRAAAARIASYVHRTPVFTSCTLDRLTGATVFFKCENFQKVGAFKARGACNTVFSLSETEAARGVITHSSGNHGAALAWAAGLRGIPATVVMPENAPPVKRAAVAGYGARIVTSGSHPLDRERMLAALLEETGAVFVHPSNDPRVIAGQGTAALELLDQAQDLDIVMTPVGGGGLLSGTALAVAGQMPHRSHTRVIGVEPETVDDAARSFRDGRIYPPTGAHTLADGLRTCLGDVTFPLIRKHVHDIITVTEQGLADALRLIWERMKLVIEPSSAVPVAALFEHPDLFRGQRVGIVLSGGNVSVERGEQTTQVSR